MTKRPTFDLAALTAEAAAPMQEATQRTARAAAAVPATATNAPAAKPRRTKPPEAVGTAELEQLAFKVPPAFRKRFKTRALEADLKLNELLFQALDAWEASRKH